MNQIACRNVRTRKEHRCWGCARKFPKGTELRVLVAAECGEIYSTYWCDTCDAYWDKHMRGEDGIAMGELCDDPEWEKLRSAIETAVQKAESL